jgi:NitT/TauT family transport system ATP-binding protein
MQEELLRVWSTRKKTVVFVTHSISEALVLSDRVVVLTARPGRIRHEFPVSFPRPHERTKPEFVALYDDIWRSLA